MLPHARDAAQFVDAGDIQKMLADIIEISCMIVTDGDEARFIHKSVQEYHAALFIKRRPDESAAKFYDAMHTRSTTWSQELRFLESIDQYRFLKLFHIPSLERLFSSIGVDEAATEIGLESVGTFCEKDGLWIENKEVKGFTVEGSEAYWPTSTHRRWLDHYLVSSSTCRTS
jgi:hypothetical protein